MGAVPLCSANWGANCLTISSFDILVSNGFFYGDSMVPRTQAPHAQGDWGAHQRH
jgi:hypothetical protein